MVNRFRKSFACILFICLTTLLPACGQERALIEINGTTMGTVYSVKLIISGQVKETRDLKGEIEFILKEINRQMSTWDKDSVLSYINRHTGTNWIELPDELYKVISTSLEIAGKTGGALDITVGPLVNIWGFGPQEETPLVPDEDTIRSMLDRTGYMLLELDPESGRLRKKLADIQIDLSAIAKGFAVDEVARYLANLGIEDYLVEIGGEIHAHGKNIRGEAWKIGIEKPLSDERSIQRIIPLVNQGMATSGDYRNYRLINGVRYSHTIDPRTGKPVTHDLAAVTVIHPSTMMADGLATALLVMGPERGLEFATENNLSALFLTRGPEDSSENMSPAFRELLGSE